MSARSDSWDEEGGHACVWLRCPMAKGRPGVQDLDGAEEGFQVASSELDQACRFMLVREPKATPAELVDSDARLAEEGV